MFWHFIFGLAVGGGIATFGTIWLFISRAP